jgi:HSP20 family protein
MFENFYGYPAENAQNSSQPGQWSFSPVFETGWDDEALHLRAILPGVEQNDVNVNLQGNQLVLTGERKAPTGFGKNVFRQLAYGKFYASVALPNGLDIDKVSCRLHDGVLDIDIPVAEKMKPRQVPIQSGSQQKAISA